MISSSTTRSSPRPFRSGAKIGEVSCPTRYQTESSSINLRRSIRYGLGVLRTCEQYWLDKHGLRHYDYLDVDPAVDLAQLPATDTTAKVRESARTDG